MLEEQKVPANDIDMADEQNPATTAIDDTDKAMQPEETKQALQPKQSDNNLA